MIRITVPRGKEKDLQFAIKMALNRLPGVLLFRNNCGVARYNSPNTGATSGSGRGQVVRYGLAPGSCDLIGLVQGRFFALEVKSERGKCTPEQIAFIDLINKNGGFARVVRTIDEAIRYVNECLPIR